MLLSSFAVFLMFATPNVFADSFDEKTCVSLISTDKVKEITGYEGVLEINVINSNLESLNEGITNGCAISFQNDDTSFTLTLVITASDSDRTAQSKYGEIFSASNQMGFEVIEGNNGPWIYHQVEVNDMGIASFLASIKDNIQVGLHSPQTDIPIDPADIREVLTIVQSNIDKLDIPKSFTPNDIEPTNVEPVEITSEHEQKIVELKQSEEQTTESDSHRMETEITREENGGGCLIATATYGSELAPQVQTLRELRDNSLLQTESGTSFMNSFNDVYYTFSPIIADYERENPVFREMVKITITPMITSLSILNNVEMDSEQSVLGYGISLIILNGMMYVGIPVAIVIGIRKI
jgi:hypothetical protein